MSWEEGYQQGQGRAAIGENAGLRNTVGNYANALAEANATIDEAQAIIIAKNQRINVLNRSLADCTQEVHDFRLKLIVETAHSAGLNAYLNAFKKAHPNSPVGRVPPRGVEAAFLGSVGCPVRLPGAAG